MAKKRFGILSRVVFSVVGVAGLVAGVSYFGIEVPMPIWSDVSYWALVIGGINWGVVSITGKEDLFEMIGL